jgi:hypothetical protein
MHGPRSGRVSIGFPEPRPNARNRRVYRLSRRLSVYGGHKSRRVRLRRREAITRRLLRVGGGLRAAARERDPQGRQRVFRDRARPRPDEVSAFIDAYRARFGVEPICRVLDVSASAYYHRATGARSVRAAGDERLLALIEQVHVDNYDAYGYRKTWLALKRRGVRVGRVASSASCARRDSGGQAARQAMADHDPGPGRAPAPGSRRPRLHRRSPRRALGRRLHLPALLGGAGVLQLRPRRLQPPRRGLAVLDVDADRSGPRRATDGADPPGRRRGRRAHPPLRRRHSIHPVSRFSRCSTITAS